MLEIKNLTVAFDQIKILQDLNLIIKESTLTCLVAPNGSGKTTLFRTITNQGKKEKGIITIDNHDSHDRIFFNQNIFFMEDTQRLTENFSAIENLELIKTLWKSSLNVDEIVQLFKIESFQHKKVKKMSLGMRQKVLIACAIMSNARILIFDEPLNGLDIKNIGLINKIFTKLKDQGKAILLSSHNIHELLKISNDVYFLSEGKIVDASNNLESINQQYSQLFG